MADNTSAPNSACLPTLQPQPTPSTALPTTLPAEVFIFVRPPPGKNHNPLNLQVQLILPSLPNPAAAAAASGRESVPSYDPRRSPSVRSGQSSRSNRSLVSFASSEASRGRRVTPLYNLQWHTVLPTWILDAGTDAKIAKFVKKGIEINDFACIEPGEIRRGIPTLNQFSPTSSQYPASSSSNACSNGSAQAGEVDPKTVAPSWLKKMKKLNFRRSTVPMQSDTTEPSEAEETSSFAPNDGAISSTGPTAGSGRRAEGYVWMVRRWMRPGAPESTILVEWRKAPKPGGARRDFLNARRSLVLEPAVSLSPAPTRNHRHSALVMGEAEVADSNNASTNTVTSPTTLSHTEEPEEDPGEDSEPEDSERAWHCELVVSAANTNTGDEASAGSRPATRTYLGSFTPQPHHPRLVGKLAVPWNLEPVFPDETEPDQDARRHTGSHLSVEELKDLIVITSMWLVVKEELGGLSGRKAQKASGLVGSKTNALVGARPNLPSVNTIKPSSGVLGNTTESVMSASGSVASGITPAATLGRKTLGWPRLGKIV